MICYRTSDVSAKIGPNGNEWKKLICGCTSVSGTLIHLHICIYISHIPAQQNIHSLYRPALIFFQQSFHLLLLHYCRNPGMPVRKWVLCNTPEWEAKERRRKKSFHGLNKAEQKEQSASKRRVQTKNTLRRAAVWRNTEWNLHSPACLSLEMVPTGMNGLTVWRREQLQFDMNVDIHVGQDLLYQDLVIASWLREHISCDHEMNEWGAQRAAGDTSGCHRGSLWSHRRYDRAHYNGDTVENLDLDCADTNNRQSFCNVPDFILFYIDTIMIK